MHTGAVSQAEPGGPDAALRDVLAAALEPSAPVSADVLRAPETTLERYALAPLRRYALWQVYYPGDMHAVVFFVAYAPDGPVMSLTGQPDAFVELARADGLSIGDPASAVAYARAYLETTRSMAELFYLVASVDDVMFLPAPSDEERARIAAFRATYAEVIQPPSAAPDGPPFTVTIYAIREQALERHTLTVARDGAIADDVTTLATDAPTVYGS
jgi:hypothetical protein